MEIPRYKFQRIGTKNPVFKVIDEFCSPDLILNCLLGFKTKTDFFKIDKDDVLGDNSNSDASVVPSLEFSQIAGFNILAGRDHADRRVRIHLGK